MSLRIRNWDRWQSYRTDRGLPPWIKVHRQVMRDPNWVALTDAQRGQLVSLWILAADKGGEIPSNPKLLKKLCFLDCEPDVAKFIELGFLECGTHDASLTPERRQDDAPEKRREEAEAEKKQTIVASATSDDGFEAFYEAFPKHVGRGQALKAYRSALKIATGEALLTGARRYAASVVGKEPQFVAHPATWLNGQRWLDELSTAGPDNVVAIDWAAFNTPEERDAQERRKQASG